MSRTAVAATLIANTALASLLLASQSSAQSVARGPYLQNGNPTEVTIRWRTDSATDARVRYGSSASSLSETANGSGSSTEHEVRLTGLKPGTQYFYSIGTSSKELAGGDADHYFYTAPPVGSQGKVRIWAIGDSGTADSKAAAVRDAFYSLEKSEGRAADIWMMLGDNAYSDGTDSEYQQAVFDMYPEILRTRVLWPTLGNHDARTKDGSKSGPDMGHYYLQIFSLPTAGDAGGMASGSENYFSFDYANIHFVCLDSTERDGYGTSMAKDGAMLTWLKADLASTQQEWIIAYFHHPPYSRAPMTTTRRHEATSSRCWKPRALISC